MFSARATLAGSPSISSESLISCVLTFSPDSRRRMFSSRVPNRLSIPRTMGTLVFILRVTGYLRLGMDGIKHGRSHRSGTKSGLRTKKAKGQWKKTRNETRARGLNCIPSKPYYIKGVWKRSNGARAGDPQFDYYTESAGVARPRLPKLG